MFLRTSDRVNVGGFNTKVVVVSTRPLKFFVARTTKKMATELSKSFDVSSSQENLLHAARSVPSRHDKLAVVKVKLVDCQVFAFFWPLFSAIFAPVPSKFSAGRVCPLCVVDWLKDQRDGHLRLSSPGGNATC